MGCGLGKLMLRRELGSWALLLGRRFVLQALLQRESNERGGVAGGGSAGLTLLLGSLGMLNAHIALAQGRECHQECGVQLIWGSSGSSTMLCDRCQHHIFLCQSPSLGPLLLLGTPREHAWPLMSFLPAQHLKGLEPGLRCSRGAGSKAPGCGSSVWCW